MRFQKTVLVLAIALATSPRADVRSRGFATTRIPEYRVADPSAPVVTERNLLENERFWPYQTALVKPWRSVAAGDLGVLIRVEPPATARVDFGRDGLLAVPVSAIDIVERANAIRLGKAEKLAPNFVFAIGARLLDPSSEAPRQFPFEDTAAARLFLCVFADPWRVEFGELAAALAPLRDRAGVQTILFPQSRRADAQVSGQLRAMKWTPPYVWAHLSEPYTRTLLDESTPPPAVLLQTADGRVLLKSRWTRHVAAKLAAAIDAFAAETKRAPDGARALPPSRS